MVINEKKSQLLLGQASEREMAVVFPQVICGYFVILPSHRFPHPRNFIQNKIAKV